MSENMTLDNATVMRMLQRACARVQEKQGWLSRLDAACGDGDHGVGMARGFKTVEEKLPTWADLAPGPLFRKVGMTLVSAIGGAAGPLMGTIFMEAGKVAGDKQDIDASTLAAMFEAGLEGIQKRGGAKPGDRTMVDALAPAVEALKTAASDGLPPDAALARATEAARTGAEETANMLPKQGKSRYLGERALGHPDAGAYSVVTVFEALAGMPDA